MTRHFVAPDARFCVANLRSSGLHTRCDSRLELDDFLPQPARAGPNQGFLGGGYPKQKTTKENPDVVEFLFLLFHVLSRISTDTGPVSFENRPQQWSTTAARQRY